MAVRHGNGFAQGGCAVSILGDFPETTGQSPENQKIAEWLRLEGTSEGYLVQLIVTLGAYKLLGELK